MPSQCQHQWCLLSNYMPLNKTATRTTRTPAFWVPSAAPWLPILVIHIRSQVKTRQSQIYKFKKIDFDILQEPLHATHYLKLLDKMCKYEMDPIRTVGATEWTRDAGRTHGRTDRRTDRRIDGVKATYPPTTSLCGGIMNKLSNLNIFNNQNCIKSYHL